MVTETSIKALKEIDKETRQIQVLKALGSIQPANNKMLANYLKIGINQVTGRIFELRTEKKFVGFSHKGICPLTNKTTNFWKLTRLGEEKINENN